MKLVHVLYSGLGGHGSVVFSVVSGDRGRHHEHVLIFYGIEELAPGYAQRCGELGVSFRVVKKVPGLDFASWAAVVRAIREERPDAIFLHSTTLVGPVALTSFRGTGLVVVEHTSNLIKRKFDWVFSAVALVLAQRTVYLTESYAREVRQRLGPLFRPDRVAVIGNGIALGDFERTVTRAASGTFRVGMLSRFTTVKDHATLIRAMSRLRGDVELILAGDGETLPASMALAKELGVRARFLGAIAEAETPALLHSLDVYVQSSRTEAMCTAVIQAMAASVPVVGSRVPGLVAMIEPGRTGLLFELGDDQELAERIEALRGDPSLRVSLARRGLEHARAHWSNGTMFEAYDRVARAAHDAARGLS